MKYSVIVHRRIVETERHTVEVEAKSPALAKVQAIAIVQDRGLDGGLIVGKIEKRISKVEIL